MLKKSHPIQRLSAFHGAFFSGRFILRAIKYFSAAISCFFTLSATAYYPQCHSIAQGIDQLIAKTHGPATIGVVIQSMDTGQLYYSRNARNYFEPASVQKLFTVSSALINLGPNYRFPTELFATGTITHGVLQGDLIFRFNGDPSLTQSDVNGLVKQLKTMGITRVVGNIIVDNSGYNNIPYPAGWLWTDLTYDYAAPLDSIIINRNRFGLSIIPSRTLGAKPEIVPALPPGAATFVNEAITTRNICGLSITSTERNQYVVRGCVPRYAGTERRAAAIRNMPMYAKSLIRELLIKNGVSVNGFLLSGRTPVDAQRVAQHYSAPLNTLIVHLLKRSDNLYADTLLKKMGQHFSRSAGSWENGVQAMYPVLSTHAGINLQHIRLIDGAGLSRYNQVSPNDLSRLLSYINSNSMLRENVVPALPVAGVDGTLAFRMGNLAPGRKVCAKTGSMAGVSSLAGFIKTDHHGLLSFVIMINNIPKNRFPYILLENNIAEFLAKAPHCD